MEQKEIKVEIAWGHMNQAMVEGLKLLGLYEQVNQKEGCLVFIEDKVQMREATSYNRGEFIETTCPHCSTKHKIDMAEGRSKGYLSETGGEMYCPHCKETFFNIPYW